MNDQYKQALSRQHRLEFLSTLLNAHRANFGEPTEADLTVLLPQWKAACDAEIAR